MRKIHRRILLILSLSLLLVLGCTSASTADSHTIANNGDWSGSLTNLDWSQVRVTPHASLDWENPYWQAPSPLNFIMIPNIKAGVELKIGGSGDFDITINQANLRDNQNIDSTIRYNEDDVIIPGRKMYRERIDKGNIFDYLPREAAYGLGLDVGVYLLAASTHPVRVQGSFSYYNITEISVENGFKNRTEHDFSYTSVKPLNPQKDQRTVVFVGSQFEVGSKFIYIDTARVKIGPIVAFEADLMGGAIAEGIVHKDEMEFERYADWDTDVIHSCTENGKDGCLEGEYRLVSTENAYATVNVKATISLIGRSISILEKHYPLKNDYYRESKQHFVQSLTWREELKKQKYCNHLYYKVPVAVWANDNKTIPISGIYVHQEGITNEDPNMTRYVVAWTGKNPKIPTPDEKGKAVLYLPYIDGKYTIVVDSLNNEHDGESDKRIMGGSAVQPSKMKRGVNDWVHIILKCNETAEYKVEKSWDIDIEKKDKPESIEVLLQAKYGKRDYFSWEGVEKATLSAGNNWTYTFTDVPEYAMNGDGQMVKIEYRIRELKPSAGDGDGAANAADGIDSGVIQNFDGLYHPDGGKLAAESKRVVPSRFDLDNIHVWEAVKGRMTDISKIIEFEPTVDYVKGLAKSAVFPAPEVSYKVKAYDTIYGEHFDDHTTRYSVAYTESDDGKTTKITNTAMLSFSMHKIWLMFGERETPKSAYLTLLYRPAKAYRDYIKLPEESAIWVPVIKPLDGNKVNIIGLLSELAPAGVSTVLETIAKFDIANVVSIPIAIGKAKERTGLGNPLNAWRVRFTVKKYGYIGLPGIPVEFTTSELTSVLLKDVVKYLTGFDIPASLAINLSGPYVSAWGTPFQLPVLDKEWEYTSDIINTWYEGQENIAVSGTKKWVRDQKNNRPEYIDILLKNGETLVATARVSADKCIVKVAGKADKEYKTTNSDENSWAWSITKADVQSLSNDIEYTIEERYPEGYANADSYRCVKSGYNLTNYWQTPARIVIRKVFDPADATRPSDLKITVLDNAGNPIGSADGYALSDDGTVTLTDKQGGINLNGKDLSKLTIGETFTQPADGTRWSELPAVSGPVKTIENGHITYTYTVTNKADVPVRVKVKKEWTGDEGKVRPTVSVNVRRDGAFVLALPLNAQNNWEAYADLPRMDAAGREYVYTVDEDPVNGYYATISKETENVQGENGTVILHTFAVTNSADTVTVKGTKTWKNDDPSKRSPITVRVVTQNGPVLDGSGSPLEQTITGAGESGWNWEFTGLPARDGTGTAIQYSVTERPAEYPATSTDLGSTSLDDYEITYAKPVFDADTRTWTCDITNTYHPREYQIFVFKNWDDDEDAEGIRPEKVTVGLKRDGQSVATPTDLSGNTNWIGIFSNLQKPADATGIPYTAEEQTVENYKAPNIRYFSDDDTGIVIITNTPDDTTMDIPVYKVWENDGDSTNARPDSVTVQLYRKGTQDSDTLVGSISLTADTEWEGTFEDIPKYDANGTTPLVYTVREVEDADSLYSLKSVEPAEITGENFRQGVTVTNDFRGMTVTVRKEWLNTEFVTLPDEISFTLYRGAGETVLSGKLKKADNWTADFGVPRTGADGQPYTYYVEETAIPYCTVEYPKPETDEQGNVTITVINTVTGVDIPVKKEWDDGIDRYGNRPGSVTLNLYAGSGESAVPVDTVTLTADTGWKGTFKGLPLYEEVLLDNQGTRTYISYSVKEADVPGYTSTVTRTTGSDQCPSFTVTNTLTTRGITITKFWDDENNRLGNRPDSVSVALMNGEIVILEATLDKEHDWTSTVTVPVMIDGLEANYHVLEKDIPEAYVSTVSGTAEDGFIVTNGLQPVTVNITVTKDWVDIPEEYPEITLRLMSDEKKEGEYQEAASCKLNADTGWTYVFTDMPRYAADGRVIAYDLKEDYLPGFEHPVVVDLEYAFIVYNRLYERNSWVIIEALWDDNDNADGLRPDQVTVELLRNGEATGKTTTLSEETAWAGVFMDLERTDETGKWIRYSVREYPVNGYKAEMKSLLEELEDPGVFYCQITHTPTAEMFMISFDPNGGTLHGSKEPETSGHAFGEVISIAPAPVRPGYRFLYWKGSEYHPGDSYRVTGDHTFTAQWERDDGGLNYKFTFSKKWVGSGLDSIDWIMYNPDGSIRHKKFNKKIISATEWQYEAWLAADQDYYIVENVPKGYRVRYENVGIHAGETDRCYNGGTIINYKIPKTGDTAPLLLWGICILLGTAGMSTLAYRIIRHRRNR